MCHQCNAGVSQVRSVTQGDFAGLWCVLGICSPVITASVAESFLALHAYLYSPLAYHRIYSTSSLSDN